MNIAAMVPKLARLAGLGAFGACGGLLLVYGGFLFVTFPDGMAGMDAISSAVAWIAVGGVVAALIVLHVVIGRQLLRLSQGAEKRHPL